MIVRAKFRVVEYTTRMHTSHGKTPQEVRTIVLYPVVADSDENKSFYASTPSGKIELGTVNQEAWEEFELNSEMYVTFERVNAE